MRICAQNWKLGHTFPKDTLEDQAIQEFARRVDELSKGEIKIKVFPAMQLGDWTVMQQRVSMGGLEMATQPASSQAEKRNFFPLFPSSVQECGNAAQKHGSGISFQKGP